MIVGAMHEPPSKRRRSEALTVDREHAADASLACTAKLGRCAAVLLDVGQTLVDTPGAGALSQTFPELVRSALREAGEPAGMVAKTRFAEAWADVKAQHRKMKKVDGKAPTMDLLLSDVTAACC